MDSGLIVVFINGTPDYLEVRERTEVMIRGWVINGHWEMVIDLVARRVFLDLSGGEGSNLELLSEYETIEIVEGVRDGDYNEVIAEAARTLAARKASV
jgi:hypothetical protein